MKKSLALLLSIVFLLTSCDIFTQFGEAKRFAQCDFTINNVKIVNLGSFNISDYKSVNDFSFTEMLSLGQQLIAGKLPAVVQVDIKAVNNQTSKASISGLEWQLLMKNEKYGDGSFKEYVEVLPGKSTIFTVNTTFDFYKMLTSSNLQDILNLVFDIDNKEKLDKLDISIKLKPYYKSGSVVKEYPGYLTIRP